MPTSRIFGLGGNSTVRTSTGEWQIGTDFFT
jgi:hypothetical protein